ncbi:CoA transferase [Candidatus Bathyarchaeota archaeon]|nr:CoA transferase [Candidatus Bathyarchaeota archaeon]
MQALEDIRVLDLTHVQAGPIVTLYMAGMGAEVIKVEPLWGEMSRMTPPMIKGQSPYFLYLNRGKKDITLNLKEEEGLMIFKELVKKSDVVIENFSAGTMERMGLGWDVLRELNPGIIYASICGFGHTGPWKDRRSFDPIAQATSGYMWLNRDDLNETGPPILASEAIADTIPGFTCLIGILAALNYRNRTGMGQRVDVAQMDSMIAVMRSFSFWTLADTTFRRAARKYRIGVSGLHRTSDGYVMFSLPAGRITDWFMELLGVDELLPEVVDQWVRERTTDEVVTLLEEAGVPVGPVLNLDEVLESPQAKAREMFVKVEHPVAGEMTQPGFPIKFSDTKGDLSKPSPLLGEHTEEVLSGLLGYSEERIQELRNNGIV